MRSLGNRNPKPLRDARTGRPRLTLSQLAAIVAARSCTSLGLSRDVINCAVGVIAEHMLRGHVVSIPGFGTFYTIHKAANENTKPVRTEHMFPTFRAASVLRRITRADAVLVKRQEAPEKTDATQEDEYEEDDIE